MKYLYALGIGLLLTPEAITSALLSRGYTAIGGEIFIPILFVVAILAIESFKELFERGVIEDDK